MTISLYSIVRLEIALQACGFGLGGTKRDEADFEGQRQVRERLETVDRDVQQNAEEEVDEDGEHESKMDDLEEIALSGKEHIGEVQEEEGNNNKGEGNNKDGRVEFRFPAANRTRLLNRGYRL